MTRTDTGRATAEQLALILDTRRAESDDDATATDTEILAHIRNTLTLPGEGAPGGFPVTDDGTAYAAALIAFSPPPTSRTPARPWPLSSPRPRRRWTSARHASS